MRVATKKNAILDRWAGILSHRGSDAAMLGPGGRVERTFADIEAEAERNADAMAGLPAGAVVAVQLGNSPSWPALVLAAMRLGLRLLPAGGHIAGGELDAALQICGARALVSGRGVEARDASDAAQPAACDFLKLTSGTTSAPRAIRFTAEQLVADCDNICETMGIGPGDLNYGAAPFSHSYGFSNLITPLLCQGVPLVVVEDRLPRAILTGLRATGATVFPGMPVIFEKLAALEAALPRLRLCISAGAPLGARVAEAFTSKYGLKVHTFYGSSECGGIGYDAAEEAVYEDGFAGAPMRGVRVEPIEGGQIEVRSAAVGLGYHPEPEPAVLGEGRFVPGDLVRVCPRGMVIQGRATDVINIAGRKLNPVEVEARLAQCPGVRHAVVFGVPSPLRNEDVIACVCGEAGVEAVMRHARAVLSPWQVPRAIWRVAEMPVNERGKLSRRELARLYAESTGSEGN